MERGSVRSITSIVKSGYWRGRFGRWSRRPGPCRPGYSLVVPVPGDLPVFLELALATCRRQRAEHRIETLVVPDVRTPAVDRIVARARRDWPGALRVLDLPRPERWFLPTLRDPGRNHGVQLVTAVEAAAADHIVLHDADLFMLDEALHDDSYRSITARDLDVLGVEGAWDPWYAEHGRTLAATWEQTSRVDWMRSVPPHRHLGHDARSWGGVRHTFDTTFWAQCRTDPRRIAVAADGSERITHFNYVISTYRRFQKAAGPYHDSNFRLLLIRLFIDLFAEEEGSYTVPSQDDLVRGIGDPDAVVHYRAGDLAEFDRFMAKFRAVLSGPWVAEGPRRRATALLAEFDRTLRSLGGGDGEGDVDVDLTAGTDVTAGSTAAEGGRR